MILLSLLVCCYSAKIPQISFAVLCGLDDCSMMQSAIDLMKDVDNVASVEMYTDGNADKIFSDVSKKTDIFLIMTIGLSISSEVDFSKLPKKMDVMYIGSGAYGAGNELSNMFLKKLIKLVKKGTEGNFKNQVLKIAKKHQVLSKTSIKENGMINIKSDSNGKLTSLYAYGAYINFVGGKFSTSCSLISCMISEKSEEINSEYLCFDGFTLTYLSKVVKKVSMACFLYFETGATLTIRYYDEAIEILDSESYGVRIPYSYFDSIAVLGFATIYDIDIENKDYKLTSVPKLNITYATLNPSEDLVPMSLSNEPSILTIKIGENIKSYDFKLSVVVAHPDGVKVVADGSADYVSIEEAPLYVYEPVKDGGLSGGAITGIVIGVLVVVGAIVGVLVWLLVFRKKRSDSQSA